MRKRGASWDNLPLPAFTIEDVDDEVVDHFKQWATKKGRIDKSVLNEPKKILMENLPLPEYTIHPSDIMIKFTAPENRVVRVKKNIDSAKEKEPMMLTDNESLLLHLLLENPRYTMLQLVDKLGVSRKTVAVRLKKLKEKGLIVRVGSDRSGYWEVKGF